MSSLSVLECREEMLRFAKIETVGFRTYGAGYVNVNVNYFYDVMMMTFEHSGATATGGGWLARLAGASRSRAGLPPSPGRQLHLSFACELSAGPLV